MSEFPEITFSLFGVPITVPPWSGQLGLEPDPMLFVAHIVYIYRKVYRVLRKDGTCWINFGDSYASSGKDRTYEQAMNKSTIGKSLTQIQSLKQPSKIPIPNTNYFVPTIKPKDLCGIPWMVAFALRDDGWYLRQDVIWSKPNPMPESVRDRCTKSHEYIFMLTKSQKYFYDAEAIKTPAKESSIQRLSQDLENQKGSDRVPGKTNGTMKAVGGAKYAWGRAIDGSLDDCRKGEGEMLRQAQHDKLKKLPNGQSNIRKLRDKQRGHSRPHQVFNDQLDSMTKQEQTMTGANKRMVWEIATSPFTDAHFATYPPEIPRTCIRAGCPEYVCPHCGAPYYPVHSKLLVPTSKASKNVVVDDRDHHADAQDQGSNRAKDGHKHAHIYQSTLVGYEKKCRCAWGKPKAGIVLDPFSGSNTTGIEAREQHRDYYAFEINPNYEKIHTKRTWKKLGLFMNQNQPQ